VRKHYSARKKKKKEKKVGRSNEATTSVDARLPEAGYGD
jgi:hypothetical protein